MRIEIPVPVRPVRNSAPRRQRLVPRELHGVLGHGTRPLHPEAVEYHLNAIAEFIESLAHIANR